MSLEAHHRFILDTMQRNQDIARNIINELEAENARLKAEVERLRNLGIKLDGYVDLVRHENERLRKAGDAMADALSPFRVKPFPGPYLCDLQKGWSAAKEGKQSV